MSFSSDLSNFQKKAIKKMETVVRLTVLKLGRSVVLKSPVGNPELWAGSYYDLYTKSGKRRKRKKLISNADAGYTGGRFRANWQYGYNAIPEGEIDGVDKGGSKTISNIRSSVNAANFIGEHYIVNNLDYAERLENGWSTQAPNGMVGLTIVEFRDIVEVTARS